MTKNPIFLVCFIIFAQSQFESLKACICLPISPPNEEFLNRDAVFSGSTYSITIDSTDYPGWLNYSVEIEIIESWKGIDTTNVIVITPVGDALCGFEFEIDTTYLIYADSSNGLYYTNICTRTKKLSQAQDDLLYLNSMDIDQNGLPIPNGYQLHQNYPNPFNATTIIQYSVPTSAFIEIAIIDLQGVKIHSVIRKYQPPGEYRVSYNVQQLPSGLYFYYLKSSNVFMGKKMLVIK